jgi:predicted amidohydrolase
LDEDDALRNRLLVVAAVGVIATYDKVHLYDAYGARESEVIAAGDPAAPAVVVDVKGVRVGVQTCYDIRFPEVSRRLIDAGAEVLVVPADWVPGEHKVEHWETLLRARAIENLAWIVAADHAAPSGIGHSMVVDQIGNIVERLDTVAGSFAVTISSEAISDARGTNPALAMRRYRVEPR